MYIIRIHFILLKDTTRSECVWGRGGDWDHMVGMCPRISQLRVRSGSPGRLCWSTSGLCHQPARHLLGRPIGCCSPGVLRHQTATPSDPCLTIWNELSADYDRDLLIHTPYNVPILLEHAVVCSDSQDQYTPTQNTYT